MTFTYDGDPSASSRDEVRFLIEDTDPAGMLIADEEISYLLTRHGAVYPAAAAAARRLVAKLAPQVSKAVGPLRKEAQQRFDHAKDVAAMLAAEAAAHALPVPLTATSPPDPIAPDPIFTRHMNERGRWSGP